MANFLTFDWTAAAHELLFTGLADRFGQPHEWDGCGRPSRGLQEKYDTFICADNFVKHWKTHREDQQNFEHDFG